MTGYGSARATFDAGAVVVEVRAVNGRFLDVRTRAQAGLGDHLFVLEEIARKRGERGRIDVSARLEATTSGPLRLDKERARAALADLASLSEELGLRELPVGLLANVPDLFGGGERAQSAALDAAMRSATGAAFDQLSMMREAEGRALETDLRTRVQRVTEQVIRIAERAETFTPMLRDRLRARIERLLSGTEARLDAGRLEQEVAFLADRADVTEELTRLASHAEQFCALLSETAEPVGKRLEFLLQEMGREVNTTGSKATGLEVIGTVLEIKAELERMREQVQNVL